MKEATASNSTEVSASAAPSAPAVEEAAMLFDISELGTIDQAEVPVEFEVQHPKTKVGSGVFITLVGKDSDAYRALNRKMLNKRFGEMKKNRALNMTAEQNEEENIRLLSATIRTWRTRVHKRVGDKWLPTEEFKPVFYAKQRGEMECNIENVKWVLANVPEIREQVEDFIQDRTNFLTGSTQD
jgi:hypothetical protein